MRIPPLHCHTGRGNEIRILFIGFREALSGGEGGGVAFQKAIGVGILQNAVNHAGGSGETKRAARMFQFGETIHDFSQASAVELGKAGKIENHSCAIFAEDFIEGELELLALDTHLQGSAELENGDAGLQFLFCYLHMRLPNDGKILKGMAAGSQSQSALLFGAR